jgi:hypothetical protein
MPGGCCCASQRTGIKSHRAAVFSQSAVTLHRVAAFCFTACDAAIFRTIVFQTLKRTGATQHRTFFRPSPYRNASTKCCSHESSMSSGCVRLYTIAGNVRIKSRQVANAINPGRPSFLSASRACTAAIPASREPAPFSAAFRRKITENFATPSLTIRARARADFKEP